MKITLRRAIIGSMTIFLTVSLQAYADPTLLPTADVVVKLNEPDSKVLLIQDFDHGKTSIRDAIMGSLSSLKQLDPSYDCVVLEVDGRLQSSMDQFALSKAPDYLKAIGIGLEELKSPLEKAGITKSNLANAVPENFLLKARSLGMRVIAGDIDFSSELGKKVQSISWKIGLGNTDANLVPQAAKLLTEARSEYFANNISNLLKENKCHRIVAIFGAAHFSKEFVGNTVIPMQEFLRKNGIPFTVAAAISGNCEEDKKPDEEKKKVCAEISQGKYFSAENMDKSSRDEPKFIMVGR